MASDAFGLLTEGKAQGVQGGGKEVRGRRTDMFGLQRLYRGSDGGNIGTTVI